MKVAVIIVNYRLKYFLEQTLLSVAEAAEGLYCTTIVVDNASGDDSIDFLRPRFPNVTFIENSKNVGFSRANNQGFAAAARADFILVLNPDTIIGRRTIRDCLDWMESHSDCVAIGVMMLDGNGQFLPESKRSFPSIWNSFCKLFGLSKLFPRSRVFARYHLRYLPENEPNIVPVLAGAFMFVRGEQLCQAGGFDEDFFMYGEVMDLAYRLAQGGWHNYYLPTPIIHYKGECTKTESADYVKIFYGAMHIFYRKHYPRRQWLSRLFITPAIGVRMLMTLINKKIVKPIARLFHCSNGRTLPTYVISDNADILATATAEGFGCCQLVASIDEVPAAEACNIILDDSRLTYEEIIDAIDRNSSSRRLFHIYSSRNALIISPKKQR